MQPTSLTVIVAALAVAAQAAVNPEITAAARAEEIQERQLSSIISGITANPGSVLSQASSAISSIAASASSNAAQTTGTDTGASASNTSPAGTSGASGGASSAAGNSAITSLQVSTPLAFGAATVVLSTLFGAAIVL